MSGGDFRCPVCGREFPSATSLGGHSTHHRPRISPLGRPDLAPTFFLPPQPEWMDTAACKGEDLKWWFPDRQPSPYREARAVCESCPHSGLEGPCLAYALFTGEQHGMWGGFTPLERRYIRVTGHPPAKRRTA